MAGHDVVREPRRVREVIGLAGQHAAVDDDLTGRENLFILGLMHHLGRAGARARAAALLEQFGLAGAAGPVRAGRGSSAVSGPAAGRVVPVVLPGPARRARPAPLTTSM